MSQWCTRTFLALLVGSSSFLSATQLLRVDLASLVVRNAACLRNGNNQLSSDILRRADLVTSDQVVTDECVAV